MQWWYLRVNAAGWLLAVVVPWGYMEVCYISEKAIVVVAAVGQRRVIGLHKVRYGVAVCYIADGTSCDYFSAFTDVVHAGNFYLGLLGFSFELWR